MSAPAAALAPQAPFATERKDAWWAGPLITALVLLSFIVYAHYRLFDGGILWGTPGPAGSEWWHRYTGGGALYLSPFFLPDLYAWGLPRIPYASPALLILWAPAGFRTTCYYYRKAYYRALFANPPGCAVKSPWPFYNGEKFLLLWQNLHRYMLYVAIGFLFFLWWDAIESFTFAKAGGGRTFGVGVGSFIVTANAACLSLYTLSCHCYRHLVGGSCNVFANRDGTPSLLYRAWKRISWLNERHMLFAWISLLVVGFTDIYITLCARGIWSDLRFF